MLYVPAARAIHHDQLTTDPRSARRRIVEFHRNRDLYMRKHHRPPTRLLVRALSAWFYLACARGGGGASRATIRAATSCTRARSWLPGRGEGIREAAEEYNRRARIAP